MIKFNGGDVMGKYLGLIIGSLVTLLGIWGFIAWWSDFLFVLKGSVPAMLIFGGVIALVAALSEISDSKGPKK